MNNKVEVSGNSVSWYKKNSKTVNFTTISVVVIFLFFVLIRYLPQGSSLQFGTYNTELVSRGLVFKGVEASGEVVAENEVLLLCPSTSIVKRILKPSGSQVIKGDVILILDDTEISRSIETLEDQLEMMRNNLLKTQLSARLTRVDLDHDIELKKLNIVSLNSQIEEEKELFDVGGISQAKMDKTEQELVLANKELKRLTEKYSIRLKELEANEQGLLLQISMKEKELNENKELKEKMVVKSTGKGVVLEIHARAGENIRKDAIMVRLSEHTTRKIEAEISDKYSDLIRNGGKVYVQLDNQQIEGCVGNIRPELKDDKINFDVFLKNPRHNDLRLNKSVEMFVVTDEKQNVLRIKKGDYFTHPNHEACYVIEGDKAIRKEVNFGLDGTVYKEILHGLDSGDMVINSSLSGVKQLSTLEIVK
ncbi:MAG: efflux RND transporter periplasmic adaptor subunit [Bacteroidales bacterium]|nr:efflux RND transporter periplasmic adaptor subunit [Bacteroidales bacterium]MBN2821486.1 efflux RND transporter periplasmic adaptor subunit [Bacteroidales bacterium]